MIYDVFKMKIGGMKKKVRFLKPDEVIMEGDRQCLLWFMTDPDVSQDVYKIREEWMKAHINKERVLSFTLSAAFSDKVSEHINRVYLRIVK
ncbi:hypothetical protein ZPAH1_orf00377 [Aeromonas phage ZPAH1]|nr:hypothetical protein ZPAH1_orf00377 [Aeromonas phage ZPAH1]